MKHLSIVRHGKAESLEEGDNDRARPLLAKGAKDLLRLLRPLQKLDAPVDFILTSPAVRAMASAEILAKALGYTQSIVSVEELYSGTSAAQLDVLTGVPEDADHVLLIGHNPALTGLISGLCAGSSQRMGIDLPTGGLAHLELEIYFWQQVRWGCGELQCLLRPKLLGKE